MKDTTTEINEITESRYNDYRGTLFQHLKIQHDILRQLFGEDRFLKFLKDCEKRNPKPVYKIPEDFYKDIM